MQTHRKYHRIQDLLADDSFDVINQKLPGVKEKHLIAHQDDDGVKSFETPSQRIFDVECVTQSMTALEEVRNGSQKELDFSKLLNWAVPVLAN